MTNKIFPVRYLSLSTSLCFGLAAAIALGACAPPAAPAKEAEDVSPPGALEGVEAEAMSSSDETETPEESVVDGPVKFDELSAPDKMKYMKTTVLPTMKKVFQDYDAEEFAKFNCGTCHGSGAKAGNFSMPNSELPALDKEEMDEHPEMSKFMGEHVVPKMAELLGEELEGEHRFGCFDCHTKKD